MDVNDKSPGERKPRMHSRAFPSIEKSVQHFENQMLSEFI